MERNIEIEKQEPLQMPEKDFDAFAKNSDRESFADDSMAEGSFEEEGSFEGSMEEELTEEQIKQKKINLYLKLSKAIHLGYKPSQQLGLNSDLEDLELEVSFFEKQEFAKAHLGLQRSSLQACIFMIELGAKQFNPYSPLLGWSDVVAEATSAGEYDAVLEELWIKYFGDTAGVPPELRLVGMLGMSAIMHCQFNKRPTRPPPNRPSQQNNDFEEDETKEEILQQVKREIKPMTGISADTADMYASFMSEKERKKKK